MRISDWSSDVCSSDLANDLVRRQVALGFGEEFDVADDGNMGFARVRGARVAVERHAGRDDDARETDEVDLERVADVGAERHGVVKRLLALVPCGYARAAGDERLDGRTEEHTAELQSLTRTSSSR